MSRGTGHVPSGAVRTIGTFLRAHALAAGLRGVVLGLSGGIDSALTARLARDALGAENVLGVLLPDAGSDPALEQETRAFGEALGLEMRSVPIGPLVDAFRTALPEISDRVTVGNTAARIRMSVLFALAREQHRLVAGTGNKTELLLGYFTKYGDGGADLLPIGDLYKTDVAALAEELDLPRAVRERPPTAGFWPGQTDEQELGVSYPEADRVLRALEELRSEEEIPALTGVDAGTVRSIVARVRAHRHKRRLPPIPKLGLRTVGLDWRD